MKTFCVSDVPKWLNKAKFYDTLICFEDFCYWIDKSFKKTYKTHYVDTTNITIDDNISEKFPDLSQRDIKRIESIVNCKHGIKTEKEYVPDNVQTQVAYKKQINEFITLSGKIDYIQDDTIYEIKSRKARLFKCLYESEKIQIQLYMYMSGIHKAQLKENYKGEEFIIDIEYDEEFALSIIQELIDYYNIVTTFLNNTEDYYKTNNKIEFIRNLRGFQ